MPKTPSHIMKYFKWGHLTGDLGEVSRMIGSTATALDATLPDGPEKSVALRKLLEAKDAAVRAALPDDESD